MARVIALFLLYLPVLGTEELLATTYWVSKTGNDSYSCAQSQAESTPKLTIKSAVPCLAPGDTLFIKSGTYQEGVINNIPGGTSWSLPVTIAAYPGNTVILVGRSGDDYVLDFTLSSKTYIAVERLVIDGAGLVGFPIWIEKGHHIRVKDCEIKNGVWQGLGVFSDGLTGASYCEFINLDVHDNGKGSTELGLRHGIYLAASNCIVEGGTYYNNASHGIHVYIDPSSGKGTPNNNIVRNVRVYSNKYTGTGVYHGTGNQVYNNIVYGNGSGGGDPGIRVHAPNTTVANNTVYNNRGAGIYVSSYSNSSVKNNISYSNGGAAILNEVTGTILSNNLSIDPKFVDPASGNFKLQTGSSAIDAGSTVSNVTKDFDGFARPQGAACDIGAHEYMAGSSVPPPPTSAGPANLRIAAATQ